MRTAIVSDLHLGSATGEDIARDPAIRRVLLDEVRSADRLVLLGDAVELRELPLADTLRLVQPFFEELGKAMAGRRVVLVPGNHDHRIVEPLLEEVAINGGRLGLEHRALPAREPAERIDAWLGEAELSIAYPGVWLRDDVYATHGHYMDCHMSLPRLECVAAAAIMRAGGHPPDPATPADYERVLRPIYGLAFGLAEAGLARGATRPSERAWRSVSGRHRNGGRARQATLKAAAAAGVPASVWLLNRLFRADFDPDLSSASIARSGIDGAAEVVRRLRIDAAHTITGHTHRGGPWEGEEAWPLPGGGQLHNSGSWVYADAFHHPGSPPGPYWPGTVTWVEDEGPPRRVRLLSERSREELKAAVAHAATAGRG
ncbi:MAG TPA: metallophosphoesterase [Solirubrobacterales bacterium]|nr:metallophosphoesterase [Solirubrobacterales bacterium]